MMTGNNCHRVTLYGKKECCLCDEAMELLERVRASVPFEIEKIDISGNLGLQEEFGLKIPVIYVDGVRVFNYRVNENKLRSLLTA